MWSASEVGVRKKGSNVRKIMEGNVSKRMSRRGVFNVDSQFIFQSAHVLNAVC